MVYTMVEMAKVNYLNNYKYLSYLLAQRPKANMSDEQLDTWSEAVKAGYQWRMIILRLPYILKNSTKIQNCFCITFRFFLEIRNILAPCSEI